MFYYKPLTVFFHMYVTSRGLAGSQNESQLSLQFKGLSGPRTLQVVVSSYADLKDFGVYRNMGGK